MISIEYKEAIVEVLDILNHSEDKIIEKIPKKLIEFWERNKSSTYKPNLDHSKSIADMELKEKTKSIISMIYINYLCEDTEKNNIKLALKKNEEDYQQSLRPDNLFKNKTEQNSKNQLVIVNKERWYTKIFNKIKKFFKLS